MIKQSPNRLSQQGFTLLEVIISFTIMSLSLAVIYKIISDNTHSQLLAKEYAEASTIAQSQTALLQIKNSVSGTEKSGTVNNKYHWSSKAIPYKGSLSNNYEQSINTHELEVSVRWKNRAKIYDVTLNTVRVFPVSM